MATLDVFGDGDLFGEASTPTLLVTTGSARVTLGRAMVRSSALSRSNTARVGSGGRSGAGETARVPVRVATLVRSALLVTSRRR